MSIRLLTYPQNKGQALVEYALLIPVIAGLFLLSTLFYQSYVQENLYGKHANYERFMEGENPSLGQEMIVSLPIP
ncbi:MAG: hypothetical protein KDK51_00615 [Deltaproteobacteria bacterium]|nr:hypothetical protein [Deltaproteobacteria bacterium]